ncbi:MAG: beta-galactosidase [Omnitrophica WOR_2 bacterium]
MTTISISEHKLWAGAEPIALIGGEVHYWRLAPESWRDVLLRVKEMGVNVIASYVCWDFHEYAPGKFDFQGKTDPRRNLTGFLDLLTEMGFWIIIRPGPYIYAEWRNTGVPEYAARFHRLDPEYLAMARRYLHAVIPVIRPYFATHGGRIILCQAENELDCWPHMYTESLGLGSVPGLFQTFLCEKYLSIEELNQTWDASFRGFQEARAVLSLPSNQQEWLPRYLDFYRFKHWFVIQAARWAVDTFRELGVDIPILMNTIAVHSNEPWAEMEKIADIVGTDLYPSNVFRHSRDEHQKYLEAVRYLKSYSRLPYIPEFEAGIWHGGHIESEMGALMPNHYRMAVISALAGGAAGWNWYMLVNRDNWYMCPINEWGRTRPELFNVFSELVNLYREIDPASLVKLAETAATIDPLQQAAAHPESEVLQALYETDVDYEFFDTNTGKNSKPLLFYAGGAWLSREGQERLVEYMQTGGYLVCIGCSPRTGDDMRSLNLLDIPEPAGVIGDMGPIDLTVEFEGAAARIKSCWIEHFHNPPGKPITVRRESINKLAVEEMQYLCNLPKGSRYTVGYTRPVGKGRLTYLGLQPTSRLITTIYSYLNISIPVRSLTPGISTALFTRDDLYYLMVVNTGEEDRAAELQLDPHRFGGKQLHLTDMLSKKEMEAGCQSGLLLLPTLPGKDATVYKIQLSEL